jgi:hypothetical protein
MSYEDCGQKSGDYRGLPQHRIYIAKTTACYVSLANVTLWGSLSVNPHIPFQASLGPKALNSSGF